MTKAPQATATPAAPAGTVIYVGAGSGNPDLITVRAREVLATTAIAVTDANVEASITALVACELAVPQALIDERNHAWVKAVADAAADTSRKKPERPDEPSAATIITLPDHATPADRVAATIEALTDANTSHDTTPPGTSPSETAAPGDHGVDIVRLVAGNPLGDDNVLQEITLLSERGIDFQIVPGMPVPATVSAFAGMAHGSTYTATDITGHAADWAALAAAPQPLVLQATSDQLKTIATQLTGRGLAATTPVSVTVHGATPLQRTHDTTLATVGRLDADLPGKLVVTVGLDIDERTKYSWWENRALYGWRVLVPRAKTQAAAMSTRLVTHGAIPQEVATISVEPPRNPAQMERAVKGIVEGRYQWVVLTSVNAVAALWDKMGDFGLDARDFAGVKIAAVGHKTAAAIRDLGISPELTPSPSRQNADGLIDVFPDYDEDLDPVGRVLYPRADAAAETLTVGLNELGWEVDDIVAYRTVRAAPPSAEIRDMIKSGGFDAVCFTSPSTVKNLVGIAGKPHQRTIIACIGPTTAAAAKELGLRVDVIPETAGVAELVDALAHHVAGLRAAGQLPPPKKKRRARKTTS